MDCQATREQLIEYLYRELPAEEWVRIEEHLRGCRACQEELASLRRVTATLDQWQVPEPPASLPERTLARLWAEVIGVPSVGGRAEGSPATPFLALVLGGLAAGVSLGLTAHLTPHQGTSLALAALGILWAVLYGSMFLAALGSWAPVKHLASVALLAGGLAILLTPVLSIPQVVEACSALVGGAKGSVVLNVLLFVVGGLYTAVPLLVAHRIRGQPSAPASPGQGLTSGLLYLVLVAPVFYLQCAALALGVGATWMAGAIVGVLAGGPAGLWLAGQRAAHA
jgi:hypothetical protein